jgi:hypothetical protein
VPEPRKTESLVFFTCAYDGDAATGFVREIGPARTTQERLSATLDAYLLGPHGRAEADFVGLGTPGLIRTLTLRRTHVIIDLDLARGGLVSTTPAQLQLLWAHLKAMSLQFAEVDSVEARVDGSCEAFEEALAGESCHASR